MAFEGKTAMQLGRIEIVRLWAANTPHISEERIFVPQNGQAHMCMYAGGSAEKMSEILNNAIPYSSSKHNIAIYRTEANHGYLNVWFTEYFIKERVSEALIKLMSGEKNANENSQENAADVASYCLGATPYGVDAASNCLDATPYCVGAASCCTDVTTYSIETLFEPFAYAKMRLTAFLERFGYASDALLFLVADASEQDLDLAWRIIASVIENEKDKLRTHNLKLLLPELTALYLSKAIETDGEEIKKRLWLIFLAIQAIMIAKSNN